MKKKRSDPHSNERVILQSGGLAESQAGGEHREYRARFVRAGRVRQANGRPADLVVEADALRDAAAGGMFNQLAIFVDHVAWYENPSLDNLVGVTAEAAWNEAEQAVEGKLILYSTPGALMACQLLDEILAAGESAPDVGLSLSFYPMIEIAEDQLHHIVGFEEIESLDVVFKPAADGRVLQALSSYHTGAYDARPNYRSLDSNQQAIYTTKGKGTMKDNLNNSPTVDTAPAAPVAPVAPSLPSVEVVHTLLTSGLPDVSKERLSRQAFGDLAALNAAIEAERTYLAALSAPGVVQLGAAPRGGRISGMIDSLDRITLAAEALFRGQRPQGVQPLSGIRELYNLLSGDFELTGVFQPERVQFANVTSSTMAGIVANALNKAVVNEYANYPQWWRPIVREQDFATLQAVKWISLGGVGELPTVAEGAAYTELTWDDNTETASFVKKGGYLGITLEAIDKDDVGRIAAAPKALAQAAWLTLSKQVSAIFTSASGVGPNLADGNALFYARTAGTNVGSTALSITEWNAVRAAMRKFTELNSGERLGGLLTPKFLLVPPELEQTGLRIMATEFDYTYALSNGVTAPVNDNAQGNEFMERINSARQRVIVVDLWTDANNWAAVCDPNLWPTIGIGYRWGRQPEVFSVASPTAGLMFTNDTLPVKVRFMTAVGAMDWRGMYKENVA